MCLIDPSLAMGVGLAAPRWLNNLPVPVKSYNGLGLRDYQIKLIDRIARAMAAGYKKILVVLPTGGGKTVIAKTLIQACLEQAFGSMFLVHRRELIRQTGETFSSGGLDFGTIMGKQSIDNSKLLQLASIQTLVSRLKLVNRPRMIVLDETHHAIAQMWARILEYYRRSFVIGLTATPERLDGRGLREVGFEILIEGPTVAELMAAGHLVSKYSYYGPDAPDSAQLQLHTRQFEANAAAYAEEPKIIGSVVDHYLKYAERKQGIVFAQNIKHSMMLERAFRKRGIRAQHIDGTTDTDLRERYDKMFRNEELDLLMNVNLFSEGYDVPRISYVGIARISDSLAFHRQALGRGMRPFEGKDRAIFCDHAGNWQRGLGLPDSPVKWSLDGHKAGRRGVALTAASEADPVRQCPSCYLISRAAFKTCPRCGHEFPTKTYAQIKQDKKAELSEIRKEMAAALRRMSPEEKAERHKEERLCQTYGDFLRLAYKRKYPKPEAWASVKVSFRTRSREPAPSADDMMEEV